MKYLKITLALLAALTLTLACGEEPEPEPIKLSASPAELNFAAEGGTIELAINSGIKPTVSCSDSWISLQEGSYASNGLKVSVKATANTGTTQRTTSIRVIGDKQSLMIPVSQDIARVKLTVNPTTVAFDRYGGEMTVTVTSSEQPTVSTSTAWCGVQAGSIGSNRETTVTIAAAANATTSSRSGSVTISCGKESVTVNLTEEAYSVSTASTTALTPEQVFNAMGPGWNMGNHMDAVSNGVSGAASARPGPAISAKRRRTGWRTNGSNAWRKSWVMPRKPAWWPSSTPTTTKPTGWTSARPITTTRRTRR